MPSTGNRTLVTGFLGFAGFAVNPSALLAERCGRPFRLIEVAYRAVDELLESIDPESFDRLLLMGVAGRSQRLRIERIARNIVDARPDVRGICMGPGPIESNGRPSLPGTLWHAPIWSQPAKLRHPSDDAGGYLCNYVYYRALSRFPDKRVGFLHVPPLDQMELARQQHALAEILRELEG